MQLLKYYKGFYDYQKELDLLKTCICENHDCVITFEGRPGGNSFGLAIFSNTRTGAIFLKEA